jgi:hypothetical protein
MPTIKNGNLKTLCMYLYNGINKKQYPVLSIEEQVDFVKKIIFNGMECKETDRLLEIVDVFQKNGLKIYASFVRIDILPKIRIRLNLNNIL